MKSKMCACWNSGYFFHEKSKRSMISSLEEDVQREMSRKCERWQLRRQFSSVNVLCFHDFCPVLSTELYYFIFSMDFAAF